MHILVDAGFKKSIVKLPLLELRNGWTTSVLQILLTAQARSRLREEQLLTCQLHQIFESGT